VGERRGGDVPVRQCDERAVRTLVGAGVLLQRRELAGVDVDDAGSAGRRGLLGDGAVVRHRRGSERE
jgi:hypothetical protein